MLVYIPDVTSVNNGPPTAFNPSALSSTATAFAFDKAFEKVDIIVTPTSPTPAYKIGEMISDPLKMYLQDVCTVPLNLAGLPGIVLPCGYSSNNLPIGLQIIGKALDEETIIRAAYAYEQNRGFVAKLPEMEA